MSQESREPRADGTARARTVRALLLELALLLAAPLLFTAVAYFSWGAGVYRFATLIALLAFVAWASSRRQPLTSVFDNDRARRVLIGAVLALGAVHAAVFWSDLGSGRVCETDMGRPSICAGEWLLRGINPWAECAPRLTKRERAEVLASAATEAWSFCRVDYSCIDPKYGGTYGKHWRHHGAGFDFMDGYKYGPLLAVVYLPFTHALLEGGLFVANFGFWVAALFAIALLARAAAPHVPAAPWRALAIVFLPAALPTRLLPRLRFHALDRGYELWPPDYLPLFRELTAGCANDIIPVALLLAAIVLAVRRRSFSAGVLCGLSFACKQLPAPLVALLLVRMDGVRWPRFVAGAVASAAAFYSPFFAWAPREMVANLLLFGLARPTNSSSIRRYLPDGFEPLVSLAQLAVVVVCVARFYRRDRRDLAALLQTGAVLSIAFVALNKIVHGNYLIWVQPFVALTLATAPFALRGPAGDPTNSPPEAPP